jgi:hypothetical protein
MKCPFILFFLIHSFIHFLFFLTGSHYVAQAYLKLGVFLLQPPKCCGLQAHTTLPSIFFTYGLKEVYLDVSVVGLYI